MPEVRVEMNRNVNGPMFASKASQLVSLHQRCSSAEEDPHGTHNRNKILEKRNIDVACTECFHEPCARLIASEAAHNAPDGAKHSANQWALCCARGDARTCQPARQNARDQASGRNATRCIGQFVRHQLQDCQHRKNHDRGSGADKRKRTIDSQPAQMDGLCSHCRGCQ